MEINIDHPLWDTSQLPPRTLALVNEYSSEARRDYLAKLYQGYMARLIHLEAASRQMANTWLQNQTLQLHRVAAEVHAMLELETKGKTEWQGVSYGNLTNSSST